MTTSVIPKLTELLTHTKCLLLDFDGPVCSVFAGRPSRTIAIELRDLLRAANVSVPASLDDIGDPLEVLRYAAALDTQLTKRVEHHLRAAEIDATRTARPTPYANELIGAWRQRRRRVAIVSNNSSAAVVSYLRLQDIEVDVVVGRTSPDPTLLKPSPYLVLEAIRALHADPERDACVLVGDSISDVIAARNAGIRCIGYANADGKHRALSDAGAEIVIGDMATLSHAAGPPV